MAKQTEFIKFVNLSICLLLLTVVSGIIIQNPLNMATSVGGQTFFNCSSDTTNPITWVYTNECDASAGTDLTVSNCEIHSNYSSHYRTEKLGTSTCNLIVFNAVLTFGRCYVCGDGFGTGRSYQAMLIVVDSNGHVTPNATELVSGEDVMISSSVSYRGPSIPQQPPPLLPSFYWTLLSDPNQNITSNQGSTTNTSVSSYIIVTAQPPNVPRYEFNLFFNPPIYVPPSCASNAPTYSTSWVTPSYPVSYAPENISISGYPTACPCDENVDVTLMCSASGHPSPSYTWFELTSNVVLSESSTITIRKDGIYQCNASNTIKSVKYYASAIANVSDCFPDVDPYTTPMCVNLGISDPACISLLVIVIFFGLNLLFFTVFIICYGCSENGRNTLNGRFPWLKKMLPCINGDGCIRFEWIFLFAIISIFASIVFFPTIIIVANCCGKKKKSNQDDINLRQEVYIYENVVKPNTLPEPESYESLQRPTEQATTSDSLYEELTQRH